MSLVNKNICLVFETTPPDYNLTVDIIISLDRPAIARRHYNLNWNQDCHANANPNDNKSLLMIIRLLPHHLKTNYRPL